MDIVKLAYQIIELSEDRDYWQREAMHYKERYNVHMEDVSRSIAQHEQNFGTMLTACLDPNSAINKMQRAVIRDPLKGAVE